MPLWGVRQSKPNPGSSIDWSQPLAQGLMGFYALNEGAGLNLYDASRVGPALLGSGFGATNPWASGGAGAALNCTVTSACATAIVPAALRGGGAMSLAAGVRPNSTWSGGAQVVSIMQTNGSAGRILSIESSSLNYVMSSYNGTTNTANVGIAKNADSVVSCSASGLTESLYLNGSLAASGTAAFSPAWGTTSLLTVGPAPYFSRNLNGIIYWAAWWGRVLTDQEHASLAANPWQLFGTPRSYFLFRASGAALTIVRRTLSDRAGSRGVA